MALCPPAQCGVCVCGSSAADTENMNPDDVVRKTSAVDIESLSVGDRQKTYNPNHYQDDLVHVRVAFIVTATNIEQAAIVL